MTILKQIVRLGLLILISVHSIVMSASNNIESICNTNNITLDNAQYNPQILLTKQTKWHNDLVKNIKSESGQALAFHRQRSNISNKRSKDNYLSRITKPLKKNEQTVRRALLGKASSIELMQSTIEAKQSLQTAVLLRDEALKAIEKILNMAM